MVASASFLKTIQRTVKWPTLVISPLSAITSAALSAEKVYNEANQEGSASSVMPGPECITNGIIELAIVISLMKS